MKKALLALSIVFATASVTFAQDDKKQEPKKEKDKKETKDEKPAGGTRMAINEKGLPGNKSTSTSTSKSSGSSTVTSSEKK